MNITIIGTGYVGLVTGTCFAEMGNKVVCADIDTVKIDKINQGVIPIYEPGLDKLVRVNRERETISFTSDIQTAIESADVICIAVGTPQGEDGSADLKHVLAVAKDIGCYLKSYAVVIDKSTVPVGTAEKVKSTIKQELEKRNSDLTFDVVSNPEFLKEGAAIDDFMKPDRVVVGAESDHAMNIMRELYRPFTFNRQRFVEMDIRSAEMTKYAANAMLATKISFMNEVAAICEKVGADVNKVRAGIGSDSRIGYSFIYPGIGYGGSCFPKDVKALIKTAELHDIEPYIINAVEKVNQRQRSLFVERIFVHFNTLEKPLSTLKLAVWGLSFKPETDDMREAPCLTIIPELLAKGIQISVFDPQAMDEAKEYYFKDLEINYTTNKYDALDDADAMLLLTEWKEFRSPDFAELKSRMNSPVIFDGRNQYNNDMLESLGFDYYQIGVKKTQ